MLANERSERASITTGKDVSKNVAEGDPLDGYGYWGRLQRRQGRIAAPEVPATSLASLVSLQVPPVTQMTPSGCFARMNKRPCLLHLKRSLPDTI